jgi:MarR family 2-MHQ and catechol resistance regulon transcriptional repressor
MAIEETLKQSKPFRNEWERMLVNLVHTGIWIDEHLRARFAEFDITPQQYNVLRILRGSAPNALSTSDIRDRMIDRASDTSRIVDRMIAKELVEKQICSEDKRRVDVVISEKGLQLLSTIESDQQAAYRFAKKLTKKEAEQLNILLDKLKQ